MELSAFSALSPKRPQFWQVAKRCCIIAASIDVAFFFIFLILDSPILAWVNLLSIAMYLTAYWAFGQRKNMLAISLIWLEVLYHSALGTRYAHDRMEQWLPLFFINVCSRHICQHEPQARSVNAIWIVGILS